MSQSVQATGMFWYRNAREYDAFLKLFSDAARLPPSYSSWKRQAEEHYTRLLRGGHLIVKAEASPDEFVAWAERTGHDVNAEGRMAFANLKAFEYLAKIRGHEGDGGPPHNDVAH